MAPRLRMNYFFPKNNKICNIQLFVGGLGNTENTIGAFV